MAASSCDTPVFPDHELLFDWNRATRGRPAPDLANVTVLEETLRDGLQNSSVRHPSLKAKIELLHHMAGLGVEVVNLGMPSSSPAMLQTCRRLAREIRDAKLPLVPVCAARTLPADIAAVAQVAEHAGVPVEVYAFVGSSPIRGLVEDWDTHALTRKTSEALDAGRRAGLPVTFVTEDTTRSRPDLLAHLFQVALDHGATRFCLCDTVGYADPEGVRALMKFVTSWLLEARVREQIAVDWHGHNDRGLAVANALTAARGGAQRIHVTALGIGERVGNVATEQFLVNAAFLGIGKRYTLARLPAYCEAVARHLDVCIPPHQPVVGSDAFRTATGTHAAAIRKASRKGDTWLADRMYSSVAASDVRRTQEIVVGPFSGSSNAVEALRRLGIEPSEPHVQMLLQAARTSDHVLSDEEILAACR